MKKICIIVFAVISASLFNLPLLYANNNYKWDLVNALSSNDYAKIQQIISDNAKQMSASDKRVVYGFVLDYSRKESTLDILHLLQRHNIFPSQFDLFNAISKSHPDAVVQFILDRNVQPNGEILLFAAEKKRFTLVNQFAGLGTDVNYQYPNGKTYANGMTALLYAVGAGNMETVKLLVERGAKVNAQANNGYTPAFLARELGLTDIYNYLREHGADDITPYQISGGPSQTDTNNNTTPASSSGTEQGMASLMDNNKQITLKGGTYRLAGTSAEIKIPGSAPMGSFSYTRQGKSLTGGYRIEKDTMIIMMEGKTYTYKIESDSSFSGHGERWTRTGN